MSVQSVFDVTDETFMSDVVERSMRTPVIVDVWAEWCGPCKQLGPVLERIVANTNGKVLLAKVDADSNPAVMNTFQIQSIPTVLAVVKGGLLGQFSGNRPEHELQRFVEGLMPSEEDQRVAALLAAGDEASLRAALEIEPGNEDVITALAELLVEAFRNDEALQLLERIPETERVRHIAAAARVGNRPDDDYDARLTALLDRVKADDEARQEFVDILELMGAHDPRTAAYRKQLTSRLY